MVQKFSQTIKTTFNKGLLTEFSELNFPDDGSIDELNCELYKAGNRTRRKGIVYEVGHVLTDETYVEGILYHTVDWINVGGNPDVEFLVVQAGNKLRLYLKGSEPLSGGIVKESFVSTTPYILDMTAFEYLGGLGAASSKIDVTSIDGQLIVASPQINTFVLSRSDVDGTFSTSTISFKIRDYTFYSDPDKRLIATPTNVWREYDTRNSGWSDGPSLVGLAALNTYKAAKGTCPPLTHPWFSGKTADGAFSVAEWEKIYSGSSLSANGHYIIDLFSDTRSYSGGPVFSTDWKGDEIKTPTGRFATVESYAGRAWYAGVDSKVYYSKILETPDYLGDCFSHNDPTAEDYSDRLATDGGYIRLPEASGIKKLHVFGSSLLVFADNGVWRISGVDGNLFQANDFSVFRITNFGLAVRDSFVSGQNAVPFWWSYNGIHTVQVTEEGGMREVNVSRETIQTFWEGIGAEERTFVTGVYNALDDKVIWAYPNPDEPVANKLNNLLLLDVTIGAFYPWKISDLDASSPHLVGLSFFNGKGSNDVTFNVVDETGANVLSASGDEVVVNRTTGTTANSSLILLTRDPSGSLTFSGFSSETFLDWEEKGYEAYAESAYNFIGDLGRKKNSPYATIFMRQTETGFTLADGVYTPVRESSMLVSAYWDFRKKPTAPPQEAYRHKLPIVVETISSFPSPTTVLSTRLKLRGRGKVVRLRFEGSEGKDFNLIGWETIDAKNAGY